MIELLNMDCMGKNPKGFQKGHKLQKWKGRKHTEETKKKMREAKLKNNPMHDPSVVAKRSKTLRENGTFAGKNNNKWKGGITPEQMCIRTSGAMREWRESVFKRDSYTCQHCFLKPESRSDGSLHAHHIKGFSDYPELRFELSNGVTLCKECHYKEHSNG